MKRISAAHRIAETIGWDAAEVRECRYQRFTSPAVYVIGDDYMAVYPGKPRHDVGGQWVPHTDQFGARGSNLSIWIAKP